VTAPALPRKRRSPRRVAKHPLRETLKTAYRAGIELHEVRTVSRPVVRRMACVVEAVARCVHCGARWTVHFTTRKPWRRCPRGCNARSLSR
jgi:hypothetical protein